MHATARSARKRSRLRQLRKQLTVGTMGAALRWAAQASPAALDAAEAVLRALGPRAPGLAANVRRNMIAAGVDWRHARARYFAAVAQHLVDALRVYRIGSQPGRAADRVAAELGALARQRFTIDASIEHVHQAVRAGRGVILAAPHLCNYLVCLMRLQAELPLTTYMRWSKDARQRELKAAWFRAAGVRVISEPRASGDAGVRARICMSVLRQGGALFITPDLALRPDAGPAVELFGRTLYLPAGPATMALRTGAALIPLFVQADAASMRIGFDHPILAPAASRDRSRAGAAEAAVREWAVKFEQFVRTNPQCWFLWGDKRWTAVLRETPIPLADPHPPDVRATEAVC